MVLTEEQKERIRKNRERALEIQKRRREELAAAATGAAAKEALSPAEGKPESSEAGPPHKKILLDEGKEDKSNPEAGDTNEEALELEDFEVGASKYVTKKEAMKMYLLPEGTLNVCSFVEKPNPHHKGWQPMKLYDRAQVRRLARERFGGLEGLVEERRKRQEKRFQKDLDETKKLFA